MAQRGRGAARRPATKFAHLRKKMDKAALEVKLLEGLKCGPRVEMTKRDWAEIRNEARKRQLESRKKR